MYLLSLNVIIYNCNLKFLKQKNCFCNYFFKCIYSKPPHNSEEENTQASVYISSTNSKQRKPIKRQENGQRVL